MEIILVIIIVLILVGLLTSKQKNSNDVVEEILAKEYIKNELKKRLVVDETFKKLNNNLEKLVDETKIYKNFLNYEKELLLEYSGKITGYRLPDIIFDRKSYLNTLVVHAHGILSKENNYKIYFTDFNQNYVPPSSQNYENFKTNWMGIIYNVIKYEFIELGRGKKKFIKNEEEYIYVLGNILRKINWLGSNLPYKIINDYHGQSLVERINILSKNCFKNKMIEDVKKNAVESLSILENFFKKSLDQFKI